MHFVSRPPSGCINDKCEEFPAELDNLIADTARTGIVRYHTVHTYMYTNATIIVSPHSHPVGSIVHSWCLLLYLYRLPWELLKPLFNYRLQKVLHYWHKVECVFLCVVGHLCHESCVVSLLWMWLVWEEISRILFGLSDRLKLCIACFAKH